MPKVCFRIPASPTLPFLSQISAFYHALNRLEWKEWEPQLEVYFAEAIDLGIATQFQGWQSLYPNISIRFSRRSGENRYYDRQLDSLYGDVPLLADVIARCDADTLIAGDIEDLLDYVHEKQCIAGCIAHFGFPRAAQVGNREAWVSLLESSVSAIKYDYAYTLGHMLAQTRGDQVTPFYINDGVVFFGRNYFKEFAPRYLAMRPSIQRRLRNPYFAGQATLSAVVAAIGKRAVGLPLRYNLPNDVNITGKYNMELDNVRIWHYLRTDQVDRQQIFMSKDLYLDFIMNDSLNKVNTLFRNSVKASFGTNFINTFRMEFGDYSTHLSSPVDATRLISKQAAELPPTQDGCLTSLAKQFEPSLQGKMFLKRRLVDLYGAWEGFMRYKDITGLDETVTLRESALLSIHEYLEFYGSNLIAIHSGGKPFLIKADDEASVSIQNGSSHVRRVSRPVVVAQLRDIRLWARSDYKEAKDGVLIDATCTELHSMTVEHGIDPMIFTCAERTAFSLTRLPGSDNLHVREAYSLLAPQSGAFGDFMITHLPRLINAMAHINSEEVTLLVDTGLPRQVTAMIQSVKRPDWPLVVVEDQQSVFVERLWVSTSLHYAPSREVINDAYDPYHQFVEPCIQQAMLNKMRRLIMDDRRADIHSSQGDSGRLYFARKASQWRTAENSDQIITTLQSRGFKVLYPQDMCIYEQVSLISLAHTVIFEEGSACFLLAFASLGSRALILVPPRDLYQGTEYYAHQYRHSNITTLHCHRSRKDSVYPHRSNYQVPIESVKEWLNDSANA